MSVIVSDYSEGKEKSMDKGLIEVLRAKIDLPCPHIRRWVCLCAGKLWTNSENAKAAALSEKVRSFTVFLFRWYFRGFADAFLRGPPKDSTKILNKTIILAFALTAALGFPTIVGSSRRGEASGSST